MAPTHPMRSPHYLLPLLVAAVIFSPCFTNNNQRNSSTHSSCADLLDNPNTTSGQLTPCLNQNDTVTTVQTTEELKVLGLIWIIENIFNPPILIIGICGNIATVVIMTQKSFRHLTISVLLIALALSDTGTLLMFPFNKQNLRQLLGVDARAITNLGCRVFFTCFRTTKIFSSWMLVLIAIERFISVWFYKQAKTVATKRNALLAVFLLLLTFLIYIGVWSTFTDMIINGSCIPNTRPPGQEQRTRVFLIVGISLLCFVPAVLMLLLTCLIVYQLQVTQSSTQQGHGDDKVRATVMLFAVTLSFFILLSPISVAHLAFHALDKNIFEATNPAMVTFREVAQVMELLNSSINFFLYVGSSRSFRREIVKAVAPKWVQKVHPSSG